MNHQEVKKNEINFYCFFKVIIEFEMAWEPKIL